MIRKTSSLYSIRDRQSDDTNTNTRTKTNAGYTSSSNGEDYSRKTSTAQSSCMEYSLSGDGSSTIQSRSIMSTTVDETIDDTVDESLESFDYKSSRFSNISNQSNIQTLD